MTDAHCHVVRGEAWSFVCGSPFEDVPADGARRFVGVHPWECLSSDGPDAESAAAAVRAKLAADARLGVGEIGLDRLKTKEIPSRMRAVFEAQLAVAAEFGRPVVLHGAKCWGELVKACGPYAGRVPAFLFHGFSRSAGLLPDIFGMNGFVSIGPALLNDHAVNYRELARTIPLDRLLVESDATAENAAETPSATAVAELLARLRGMSFEELSAALDANARRMLEGGGGE